MRQVLERENMLKTCFMNFVMFCYHPTTECSWFCVRGKEKECFCLSEFVSDLWQEEGVFCSSRYTVTKAVPLPA